MKSSPFLWFGIGIIFILIIHFFISQFNRVDEKLNLASASYKKGEQADSIATRKDSFNEALAIYKDLDKEYAPTYGNGKLDYNIANSYFQLEEYPKAIVHYLRALALSPRDKNILANLNMAKYKLGVAPQIDEAISKKIFFFHYQLSLPEKLQAFFILTLFLFILSSIFIWKPLPLLKSLIAIFTFCFIVLILSLFYSQFIEASKAVILKANLLYKDSGTQYAKVLEQPAIPGTVVTVLEVTQNGKWLKIEMPDGTVGFIPYESIEVI